MNRTRRGQTVIEFALAAVAMIPLLIAIGSLGASLAGVAWLKIETFAISRQILYGQAASCQPSQSMRAVRGIFSLEYDCKAQGSVVGKLLLGGNEITSEKFNLTGALR